MLRETKRYQTLFLREDFIGVTKLNYTSILFSFSCSGSAQISGREARREGERRWKGDPPNHGPLLRNQRFTIISMLSSRTYKRLATERNHGSHGDPTPPSID